MTKFKAPIDINIFDTLTNQLQQLKTLEKNVLKMYVCGPTIYDRPHLGNARSIVIYDLFYRLFLKVFDEVIFVRNITDVDDKINHTALERKISIQALTQEILQLFYQDINALNVLKPSFEPKVTENIPEIIALIQRLLDNKHAYIADNHVLFDVSSCKNYGKLSNRKIDELLSGARIEIADYKNNPLDFVLWKPASPNDDISSIFESPWGKGRPGWHIECSAMSLKFLGENFDIHGGGADLQFPHHENEIAQSCSAYEGSNYASFWVHNGFLTVNGEKMSKSLKNFLSVYDLTSKGIRGSVVRLMLLSSHYRKPFDFNDKILQDSQKTLQKFHEIIDYDLYQKFFANNSNINLDIILSDNNSYSKNFANILVSPEIIAFLADDLNFAKVMAHLHSQCKTLKHQDNPKLLLEFIHNLYFLGILDQDFIVNKIKNSSQDDSDTQNNNIGNQNNSIDKKIDKAFIEHQIALRHNYKIAKDFVKADEIRTQLLKLGVVIVDNKEGTTYNFSD